MSKILVIDDELNFRKLIQVNLAARGHQVFVALDGEKGLKLAKLERPDLILLDLKMPGMSGWDVLMVLNGNQELQKIPVIITTAAISEGEKKKGHSMGVVGYLIKPFRIDELLRQVEHVLVK